MWLYFAEIFYLKTHTKIKKIMNFWRWPDSSFGWSSNWTIDRNIL